jgi:hypothetical protein
MTAIASGYMSSFFDVFEEAGTAVGEESDSIRKQCLVSFMHSIIPFSSANIIPEVKFLNLKTEWEEDTGMLSSDSEIALHPAYQQIIGMGQGAIPLILNEMKKKRGQWFWALKSITGEDPVPLEIRGNIKKMTGVWIKWGEEKGYL